MQFIDTHSIIIFIFSTISYYISIHLFNCLRYHERIYTCKNKISDGISAVIFGAIYTVVMCPQSIYDLNIGIVSHSYYTRYA